MCFRKKKVEQESELKPMPKECAHKYRDFPWYCTANFTYLGTTEGSYQIKVIKPYVCVHCGKRKDVLVDQLSQVHVKHDDTAKIRDLFLSKYQDKLQPTGVVEEAINDMLLVDRAYLKIIDDLNAARTAPSPFQTT